MYKITIFYAFFSLMLVEINATDDLQWKNMNVAKISTCQRIVNLKEINTNNNEKFNEYFKNIHIQNAEIIVPNKFELAKENASELEDTSLSEERIKKIVSYHLQDKIQKHYRYNKELACLYLITSIWAGNDNGDLLSELNNNTPGIINDIKQSRNSLQMINEIIEKIKNNYFQ
jgi:hypothetical protein